MCICRWEYVCTPDCMFRECSPAGSMVLWCVPCHCDTPSSSLTFIPRRALCLYSVCGSSCFIRSNKTESDVKILLIKQAWELRARSCLVVRQKDVWMTWIPPPLPPLCLICLPGLLGDWQDDHQWKDHCHTDVSALPPLLSTAQCNTHDEEGRHFPIYDHWWINYEL